MLAEGGQFGQFLRDGNLQVMSGHAFVIRGRLDIQPGALREVARVHHDVARPRTIGSAIDVGSVGRFFLAKFFDRHHFELSLGQASEHLRQTCVHLIDVLAVEVEDFLSRMRMQFGIRIDRRFETLHVLVAKLVHHGEHATFDILHLLAVRSGGSLRVTDSSSCFL